MRRAEDPWADFDVDRFNVFVPAVMSAGLLISIGTLAHDAVHRYRRRGHDRRRRLAAQALADHVRSGQPARALGPGALRPRAFYAVVAAAGLGICVYLLLGATSNYLREWGYVSHIAWLWAASMLSALAFGFLGAVGAVTFVAGVDAPAWTHPLLLGTPLTQQPPDGDGADGRPGWVLGTAVLGLASVFGLLTLTVWTAPHLTDDLDEWIVGQVSGWSAVERLQWLDPLGNTRLALLLALLVGLATLRCRLVATVYLSTVGAAFIGTTLLRALVDRPRPPGPFAGLADSYPSGHIVQAVVLAGLVPLALWVITARRWLAVTAGLALAVGAAGSAVHRVWLAHHWPTDTAGGALLGALVVLCGYWVVANRRWHRYCRHCPWCRTPGGPRRGAVHVPPALATVVTWTARGWAAAVVAGLAAAAYVVGLPTNPEGNALGSQVERPLQLGLLALAGIAALVAWRWPGAGAVGLALAGAGLAALSGVAHPPVVALAVGGAFVVPAVAFWLLWQQRRRWPHIVALALVTAGLLGSGWTAAAAAYDHYFGPAHPTSPLRALPRDRVDWMWAGGVTATEAIVAAHLDGGAARVLATPAAGGEPVASASVAVPPSGVVQLRLVGLRPGTAYDYTIEVDGRPDTGRGTGRLTTFPDGPRSFSVAVASCARTGSSGAVYDAIRAASPDLFLVTGDLHYGNIAENSVSAFRNTLGRSLRAPSQAALYRSTPVAYIWDDHDYGPNDADASSPSRSAARAAYREDVPSYPLAAGDGDEAIYQAFSIGRVRFVLTDTRSERTGDTMLGERQLAWLERELIESSRTHALVVWVNPDPWIGPDEPGRDGWAGHPEERRRIADAVAADGIVNLVMLGGDAHMVAIDDGSNSGYATGGGGGFPILQAAALDRPGNVKGGPYSEGALPGAGQFGVLRVDDDGTRIGVTLAGYDWTGRELLSYRFDVPPA